MMMFVFMVAVTIIILVAIHKQNRRYAKSLKRLRNVLKELEQYGRE